jgi:L-fuconolactonase
VQRAHRDQFALVKPVDPVDPAVADVIADWKKTPGTVGIRIILDERVKAHAGRSGARPHFQSGRQQRFPGQRPLLGQHRGGHGADRPPPRRAVHHRPYGHPEPSAPPASPQPWADLLKVVELARRKNAVILITCACTLSKEPYPYPDIWDPLFRIFDAWSEVDEERTEKSVRHVSGPKYQICTRSLRGAALRATSDLSPQAGRSNWLRQ